ncbi:MAG TPA: hypothetical protein VFV38_52800 [Ktedonobacteraceae bacterium]|nr:hypothetical protein [Ktedonobacteraceae bacterium]
MKMCIDIDQTIATGFLGETVEESLAHYRARQVAIPPDVRHYKDFFGLPEVIRIHEEIPNALYALQHLEQTGQHDIGYFTVRHSDDRMQQEKIRVNTRRWLAEHHFPRADNVSFFIGMPAKLYDIGKHIRKENQPLVMIDDSWEKVLDAYVRIQHVDPLVAQSLATHLVLFAFGATQSSLPTSAPITLRALPDWAEESVKECFNAIDPDPQLSTL